MENEIWKDIPEYENRYQVSDFGRVKNIRNGHILIPFDRQPNTPRYGYMTVHLSSRHLGKRYINKTVHSLVLLAFVGKRPIDNQIHHIDHDRGNNKLTNLIYCTQSYNRKQDFIDGVQSYLGEKNNLAIVNSEIVLKIVELRRTTDLTLKEIGLKYGLSLTGVSSIMCGHTWSHITGINIKPKQNV